MFHNGLELLGTVSSMTSTMSATWKLKVNINLFARLCPTLCDPMDCILPSSSVHGILQARILEWVAISFSKGSYWPRDQTPVSCIVGRFFTSWATREVGCPFLLQGIFLTQGSNPGLLFYRQILYHLNLQGSPRATWLLPLSHPLIYLSLKFISFRIVL